MHIASTQTHYWSKHRTNTEYEDYHTKHISKHVYISQAPSLTFPRISIFPCIGRTLQQFTMRHNHAFTFWMIHRGHPNVWGWQREILHVRSSEILTISAITRTSILVNIIAEAMIASLLRRLQLWLCGYLEWCEIDMECRIVVNWIFINNKDETTMIFIKTIFSDVGHANRGPTNFLKLSEAQARKDNLLVVVE